ncbi:MAG: hypothetical protein QGH94_15105 [Phycisphaerae bacterium]|nr:hypothetical protein [Phycisphaerae bacterium]
MSAEKSEIGQFKPCPSCGRTVIVPTTAQPSARPVAKSRSKAAVKVRKDVRARQGRIKQDLMVLFWKVMFGMVIGVVGVTVYFLTRPGFGPGISFDSPNGEFPPMIDVMVMLRKSEYISLNADGAIETLDGRRLQRFSYATSGPPAKRHLRRIDLWCPISDSNRIVALSSVLTSPILLGEQADQGDPLANLNSSKPPNDEIAHVITVWTIVDNISDISEWNESRTFVRDRARGLEYRRNRFLLELHEKTPDRQADGRLLYDKRLVLKDRSW